MTRLLLIGMAGLDWHGLTARLRRGELPHLTALAARGASGWLRAAPPRSGPAAWTTLATGTPPEVHGVVRPEEAWAGGLRPLTLASWRAPPAWSRLAAAGVSVGSVAWPGARSGVDGLHIDEDFAAATGEDADLWALPLRCAPPDVREALRDLRVHPTDITGEMLRPLVPGLRDLDQARDTGLPRLAVAMARAATVQAAAAWMLEQRRAQAVFIHHAWLGDIRDAFDAAGAGPFAHVVDGAWRFLDRLVGRLAQLAGPDALVLAASPGRGAGLGGLIAAGPGIAAGARLSLADDLDLAPTILARFGLEAAGLAGRTIPMLSPPGPRAAAPAPPPTRPGAADADLLATAMAAGYPPPPPAPARWHAGALAEQAVAVLDRDPRAACGFAAEALHHDPTHAVALGVKALAHAALGEAEPLADLASALLEAAPDRGWGALAHAGYHLMSGDPDAALPWLERAEADPDPDVLQRVAATWLAAGRPAKAERLFRAIAAATPDAPAAHIGLAMAATARRDFRAAEAATREALRLDPGRPAIYLQLAQIFALSGRAQEAATAAEAAGVLGASPAQTAAARAGRLAG